MGRVGGGVEGEGKRKWRRREREIEEMEGFKGREGFKVRGRGGKRKKLSHAAVNCDGQCKHGQGRFRYS